MNNNNLEKFIRDNKSLFDEEPPAFHYERFIKKIERKQGRTVSLLGTLSIAASIAIIILASIIWLNYPKHNLITQCENADDMKICYLEKMNKAASQIEELITDLDQWDRLQVMSEVQDIIDAVSCDFESELPEELPNDLAKKILADYYRQNLEGLEMVINQLTVYE